MDSPLRYNPVAAASRLHRRGIGYEPLFRPGAQSDEPVDLYNKHDELTAKFLQVSGKAGGGHGSPEQTREASRALFEEQERKRYKHIGKEVKDSGTTGDMFRRTRSAPDSPLSPPTKAGRTFMHEKDSLRPGRDPAKGLQRRACVPKTTQEIYNEMAMPWLTTLGQSSPKVDRFSDHGSEPSQEDGFTRTQSAPSPQKEDARPENPAFVRTQSAPSGYKEDFSRLSSNASASTNESSESQVHESFPDHAAAFTRIASAPAAGHREQSEQFANDNSELANAPKSARTPRSAPSIGRSPRAAKVPLQSAEEAADELMRKGLNAEWMEENVMPFCVAEQLSNRLNWDEGFTELFPGKSSANGIFTPTRIQVDFAEFLDRRDVRVINISTEMQAQSASHVLRFFTTNEGHEMLRKKGGSVSEVLDGGFATQDRSISAPVRTLVQACCESCRVVCLKHKGISRRGGACFVENAIFPDNELGARYEVFSAATAGFYVFRHLDGQMGGNLFYRNVKYEHYCGWVTVHRADKKARTSYKVQYVSAFSASLIRQKTLMNMVPYAIRPRKNLMATLIYYLLYDKADSNFDSIRATCGVGVKALSNLASSLGIGKHHR